MNSCTLCGAPGIPGLLQGAGKCQYHYNVGQFGQAWADRILHETRKGNTMSIESNGIIDGQNIFVIATRNGFVYHTFRGPVQTEQLWQMPLTSKNQFDLDHVARNINTELKGMTEESFVNTKPNPAAKELAIKLEVVKYIIATKQAEAKKAADARARAEERDTLLQLKESKKLESLQNLTQEEIDARLADLERNA